MNSFPKISSFKIILTFVCLAIVGVAFVPQLPIKLSPSRVVPQLNVSFSMPGMSPLVVEAEVTSKLEAMLGRIKGVDNISSFSGNGWGEVTIRMNKNINPEVARFEVSTIVRQVWSQLPQGVSYPSVSLGRSEESSNRPFLTYTIIAPQISMDIQQFAEKQIKPILAELKNVYQVDINGATPMEWQLEYNYEQLEGLNITIENIQTAIYHYFRNESMGITTILSPSLREKRIGVMLLPLLSEEINIVDLEKIEIKKTNELIIYLKDIATIKRTESPSYGYYRIDGNNMIYLSITADKNANQLDLAKTVKAKLEEIKLSLPGEYDIQLSYDATEYLKKELNKIYFRSGLTLLVLLLFVVLTYRSVKYILLICCSLFVNLAFSAILYYLVGVEIHFYSLAGITISLTLLIDNIIIMSDQVIKQGNKKAFLAILAATLTTVSSLILIFFLEESIRLNLQDFAVVIIINLSISMLIALFFVPALIEKMNFHTQRINKPFYERRLIKKAFPGYHKYSLLVYFNKGYTLVFSILWRWRRVVCIILIVAFGLPIFLLPDRIEGSNKFAEIYNKTFGSKGYIENFRPYVNIALGGTWRLFSEKVDYGFYWNSKEGETMLHATVNLPQGYTLQQMNELVRKVENYLNQFPAGIKQFEVRIYSANSANITIRFEDEHQQGEFPQILKSRLILKTMEMGGGSWSIYGVGDGFSNDFKERAGSYHVELLGYNYDNLKELAEKFRKRLLDNVRIQEVYILSEFSWYKEDNYEFRFRLDEEVLTKEGIKIYQIYSAIKPFFEKRIYAGELIYEGKNENLILYSRHAKLYDLWDLEHLPIRIGENEFKLSDLAIIDKYQTPQKIGKENQQYRLCVQYEYIGSEIQARRILNSYVEEMKNELPLGYTIKDNSEYKNWRGDSNQQYWLLGVVFIIIYFCSSILFNSFRQPLHIVFIIPLSFIGLFLTFYLFNLNFDQGGFTAFILLSGLTVNANIYIINEYNNVRKQRPNLSSQQAYLKAWNAKVRPIFLTVISTVLGFVPFMVGDKEGFWFPLAAGTIGGLIVSFIATFCFLPLFMGREVCRKQ